MRILVVFGTRPEALKLAPVVMELRSRPEFECVTCATEQHREMLRQVLNVFSLGTDFNLGAMTPDQNLCDLAATILSKMTAVLEAVKPDCVLVQGDTTTTLASSLAAFYNRIPVAHVEAGLRTNNVMLPFPEELNRRLVGKIASLHFAPTISARDHLLQEGVPADRVFVTGNTTIDTLLLAIERLDGDKRLQETIRDQFRFLQTRRRLILVTIHRRESFERIDEICQALVEIAQRDDVQLALPVHPNPTVSSRVTSALRDKPNIHLIPPQDYLSFVFLMKQSWLIMTDSGGIQEEAPTIGKPILVLRDLSERSEAVAAGTARIVGTDPSRITREVALLCENPGLYSAMQKSENPFGDGNAARRVVDHLSMRVRQWPALS